MSVASSQLPRGTRRPRAVSSALVLLLLALGTGLWAQQARGRPTPPPAEDANAGLVEQLYAQARRAVYQVPALLAPQIMSQIARDEVRQGRRRNGDNGSNTALADFQTAFALARALPTANGDADLDQAREQVKAEVEAQAVAELARQGYQQQALQLTRTADVPKAGLYDQLIEALARPLRRNPWQQQDSQSSPTQTPAPPLLEQATALVDECERAGGGFPYRGVAELLRWQQWDRSQEDDDNGSDAGSPAANPASGLERMLLVEDGYDWAGNESDPARMQDAVNFLEAGHRVEPELDPALETALSSLLRRLGGQADNDGAARNTGSRGLALLRRVAPQEAATLSALWPTLATPGDMVLRNPDNPGQLTIVMGRGGYALQGAQGPSRQGRPPRVQTSSTTTVTAPAPDPQQQDTGSMQFRVLVAKAESQRRSHPSQALAYANQASSLLDQQLWQTETLEATRLASVYQQLGASADAARLLQHALAETDRLARQVDAVFASQQPSQQAQVAATLQQAQAQVLGIYSLAARLDLPATAAHAENANFTALKPLVLARLALVGSVTGRQGQSSRTRRPRAGGQQPGGR